MLYYVTGGVATVVKALLITLRYRGAFDPSMRILHRCSSPIVTDRSCSCLTSLLYHHTFTLSHSLINLLLTSRKSTLFDFLVPWKPLEEIHLLNAPSGHQQVLLVLVILFSNSNLSLFKFGWHWLFYMSFLQFNDFPNLTFWEQITIIEFKRN